MLGNGWRTDGREGGGVLNDERWLLEEVSVSGW